MSTRLIVPLKGACETTHLLLELAITTCTHKVSDLTTLCAYISEVDFYALKEVLEAV